MRTLSSAGATVPTARALSSALLGRRFRWCDRVSSCRWVTRRQASARNASWMSTRSLPADPWAPEAVQPRGTPLHGPALGARSSAASSDGRHDAAVGERRVGCAARSTDTAANGRGSRRQGRELGDIVAVAAGQRDGERGAAPVCGEVVFRAGPAPVRRRGARVAPHQRSDRGGADHAAGPVPTPARTDGAAGVGPGRRSSAFVGMVDVRLPGGVPARGRPCAGPRRRGRWRRRRRRE